MAKIDLIKSIAENMKQDLILDGVPASLTGSSIDHLDLIFPLAEQLRGKHFYIYSGAGAGQDRVVGSYIPANKRLIFDPPFTTTPSTNSNFILTDKFKKSDYDNAINRFISIAKTRFLEDVVATMQFVGSQYEYVVPSGMAWISTIRLIPSTNSDYSADEDTDQIFEVPPRFFRIERNSGGSYLISIDSRKLNIGDVIDKQLARVMGQARPDIAATDNATIPEELEEYIVAGASMQLSSQRIGEGREWERMFLMFRDEIKSRDARPGLEDYIFRYGRGKSVGGG